MTGGLPGPLGVPRIHAAQGGRGRAARGWRGGSEGR